MNVTKKNARKEIRLDLSLKKTLKVHWSEIRLYRTVIVDCRMVNYFIGKAAFTIYCLPLCQDGLSQQILHRPESL
jgi:hypothetical protein